MCVYVCDVCMYIHVDADIHHYLSPFMLKYMCTKDVYICIYIYIYVYIYIYIHKITSYTRWCPPRYQLVYTQQ